MATNGLALIQQGTLNKVRSSLVIPAYTSLNVTASFMGKNFLTVSLEEDVAKLIPTGTGGVYSPEPYVFVGIAVEILRTQSLTASWRTQFETNSYLGDISVWSDTAAFPEFDFHDATIVHFNPNSFSGEDPVSQLMIRATYPVNSSMWSLT